jgi:hypothetical protein
VSGLYADIGGPESVSRQSWAVCFGTRDLNRPVLTEADILEKPILGYAPISGRPLRPGSPAGYRRI